MPELLPREDRIQNGVIVVRLSPLCYSLYEGHVPLWAFQQAIWCVQMDVLEEALLWHRDPSRMKNFVQMALYQNGVQNVSDAECARIGNLVAEQVRCAQSRGDLFTMYWGVPPEFVRFFFNRLIELWPCEKWLGACDKAVEEVLGRLSMPSTAWPARVNEVDIVQAIYRLGLACPYRLEGKYLC